MVSLDVTLRTLTLGNQDSTTGWYGKSYANSTVEMYICPKGSSDAFLKFGRYANYKFTGFCKNITINEGDQIIDASSRYYLVKTVTPYFTGDRFDYYMVELERRIFTEDRPSTSGTWILESTLNLDPRYRQKVLLEDGVKGLIAANMKEDDNVTNATYITTFGKVDYPLPRIFITKAVDLIFCIESATTQQLIDHDYTAHAYIHDVPITIWAIDKAGITATRLIRAAEHELERIVETYPTGSIRSIGKEDPTEEDIGECILWSKQVSIHYKVGKAG